MRSLMVVALAVLVACGDPGGGVDFSGDEMGPDVHAIVSEDGNVKMGLTGEWVYFALSDSMRAEARAELDEDAEAGGLKGFFGGIMRGLLGKALGFRARYAVSEIRDIRWEDGRMRIVFTDPEQRVDENLTVGDDEQSLTEAFAEEDVKELAEAFRTMKDGGDRPQR